MQVAYYSFSTVEEGDAVRGAFLVYLNSVLVAGGAPDASGALTAATEGSIGSFSCRIYNILRCFFIIPNTINYAKR